MVRHKTYAHVSRTIQKDGVVHAASRTVPEEVPIAFSYGGSTHAVMMASPADLKDFALGFSMAEKIISQPGEIENIELLEAGEGIDVQITLTDYAQESFTAKRRMMAGPVGCGLCGLESIDDVMRDLKPLQSDLTISHASIHAAISQLNDSQQMRAETGAVHAAGFVDKNGKLIAVREDVGRHNALDKLIGALVSKDLGRQHGAVIMTSRVSVDLIQKIVTADIPILIAVSTPTALAIRTAEQAGLTLVALAHEDGFEIYTHPHRISMEAKSDVA